MQAEQPVPARKGRGAASNRVGRFEACTHESFDDGWGSLDAAAPPLITTVTCDASRSVIARNDSPDVPFAQSINPYRGCEHGCIYCYARPSHAYLGFSPGLDFETRLLAKPDAPALLARELGRPGYRCAVIALGTNTDPYQPVERRLGITRGVLQVLAAHRHPVSIVTKSALIERDIDILAPLAAANLVQVMVSVTTLDRALARRLEPRAAAPQRRLETIRALNTAGVPTGVLVAPVIPVLNDAEIETILRASTEAGATEAGYQLLRLPHEVAGLFGEWLAAHVPLQAAHVLSLLRQAHGGREADRRFGRRMRGSGAYAQTIARRFDLACVRLRLASRTPPLDTGRFHVPRDVAMPPRPRADGQLTLF